MLFNSIDFLIFFPIVCLIYYLIPVNRYRNLFLLAASYYFYMNWKAVYALLLLTSTAITYAASLGMAATDDQRRRKTYLIMSITLNLLILVFFKYFNFLGENVTAIMHAVGLQMSVPEFNILLPVGISFYTFQALGYSIDVYRGKTKAERNFFTYALFVSFFPQLVAGPIERSTNLLRQFAEKHKFDGYEATEGLKTMLWGYFLKIFIAERCAAYVNLVYNNLDQSHSHSVLIASALFCFQLYGDFGGYSLIAIGSARIMGFKLMDNFKRPYFFSTSIQDYWKRNHISLTTWFMDYVYYPLADRKASLNWWCFAMFVTFVISGFWHGAAWTFVIWGTVHGLLMVSETKLNKRKRKFEKKHKLTKATWYIWLQRVYVFLLLTVTAVLFRAESIGDAIKAYKRMFSPSDLTLVSGKMMLGYCIVGIFILFVKEYAEEYNVKLPYMDRHRDTADVVWMLFLCYCILFLGVFDGTQFYYFQF